MKIFKYILNGTLFYLFVAFGSVNAQSIERQVLASSGNTISNGTISLDQTLGEVIVGDVSNSAIFLTQGFHQTTVMVSIKINPKVYLQGPLSGSVMGDNLRSGNYLPITSPYADNATCNASVFNTGGTTGTGVVNDNIVDWMWIELRDANDNTNILASKSGLLQRDGDIVGTDGVSILEFDIAFGDYFIVVNHRNHLGIMTLNTVSLSDNLAVVDFTDANTPITYGTDAQTIFNVPTGFTAMWSGDANGDGVMNYLGALSEIPSIRFQVFNDPDNSFLGGPPSSTYASLGYNTTDLDMNGITKFSGVSTDVLIVRDNIFNNPSNSFLGGPPSSTYTFIQQLPEGGN